MTLLGEFINFREEFKASMDQMIYGTAFLKKSERKWFNPMRYILGDIKLKRLNPRKMLIKKEDYSI